MQLPATWCTNLISSHFTGATSGRRSMNNTSQRSWCSIWQYLAVSGRCSASASCLCFTFFFFTFKIWTVPVRPKTCSVELSTFNLHFQHKILGCAGVAGHCQICPWRAVSRHHSLWSQGLVQLTRRISVAFELQFATCVERICFQWWTPVQVKHMEKEWKGWMLWQFQGFLSLYHWQLPSTPWAGAPTPKSPAKHGATLSSGQSFLLMIMPL